MVRIFPEALKILKNKGKSNYKNVAVTLYRFVLYIQFIPTKVHTYVLTYMALTSSALFITDSYYIIDELRQRIMCKLNEPNAYLWHTQVFL